MIPHWQKILYSGLLIGVIFILEASIAAKLILVAMIFCAAYMRKKRREQLNGQVIEQDEATKIQAVLLFGILLFHSLDSSIRVFAETTFIITMMTWFFQSIRLKQKYTIKILFNTVIVAILALGIHIELNKLGVEFQLVKANATYAIPLLVGKIIIEVRVLTKEFRRLTRGIERKVYDPNENNWFASTFGIVSHNLKTPLASIQGQFDIIRLKLEMAGVDGMTNHFQQIEQSISATRGQLEQTISTFKSRIDISKYPEPSLILLVEQLKKEYTESIVINGTVPPLPISVNEFFALNLSLEVIQDNALKYGKGPVTWTFNDYDICVKDNGPGFSEKMITTQGNEMQHSSKTGGVGLFYTKSLLKTVGWTLVLSNKDGACVQLKKAPIGNFEMAKFW